MPTQFTTPTHSQPAGQDSLTRFKAERAMDSLENVASSLKGLSEILYSETGDQGLKLSESGRDGLSCLLDVLSNYLWDNIEQLPSLRSTRGGADHE